MATYAELHSLFNNDTSIYKVEVAVIETARIIASGEDTIAPFSQVAGAHDDRIRWAGKAITNTSETAKQIYKLVLAQNKNATVAQIQSATDSAIQTNVNSLVDALAKALTL